MYGAVVEALRRSGGRAESSDIATRAGRLLGLTDEQISYRKAEKPDPRPDFKFELDWSLQHLRVARVVVFQRPFWQLVDTDWGKPELTDKHLNQISRALKEYDSELRRRRKSRGPNGV